MFVQIIRFSSNHRCSHHTYIKKKHRQLGYKAKLDNNYDLWSKPNFSLRSDHMLSKFTPLSSDNNFFSRSENTFTNLVSDHIFSLKSSKIFRVTHSIPHSLNRQKKTQGMIIRWDKIASQYQSFAFAFTFCRFSSSSGIQCPVNL